MAIRQIRHLERLLDITYFKENGLSCVVRTMCYSPVTEFVAMHDHEFSELVVVASGHLKHIHAGGTTKLRQGDFFVVHPGKRHGYAELVKGTTVYNLLYHAKEPPLELMNDGAFAHALFPKDNATCSAEVLGRVPRREMPHLLSLVKAIRREEDTDRPSRHISCATLFKAVLIEFSRWANDSEASSLSMIQKEIYFIATNLGRKIVLEDLCAVSGRSASSINRLFHKTVGKSPIDYVISQRLVKAEELLADKEMSLEKVAEQTGFCSASHLSHMLHAKQIRQV